MASELPEHIRALIPSGLRPEIVHGICLWLAGYSTHEAGREANCPQRTLWDHIKKLDDSLKSSRATYADTAEDLVFPIIQEAARQTHEHLIAGRYKPMEVATVMAIATDKLCNLQRVRLQAQQLADKPVSGLEALLSQIATSGGSITATVSVEPNRVVDTTSTDVG